MAEKPYTRADVELVEKAIHDVTPPICDGYVDGRDLLNAEACAVLDALASGGRLLPAGGKKRTEHEIDWRHRYREQDNPTMTYEDFAEHQIDNEIAQAAHLGYEPRQIRRRFINTWPDGATLTGAWETR